MKNPKVIKSLSEIINKFDTFIIDQWGVMHDGIKPYQGAKKCIEKLDQLGKKMIIISNSSKSSSVTTLRLIKLGFNSKNFNKIITSGDIIYRELKKPTLEWSKKLGKNCYHLSNCSKSENNKLIKSIGKNKVEKIELADFILGTTTNPSLSLLEYSSILKKSIDNKLPFVCANPDFESVEKNSDNRVICMGAVGKLYESFGGTVHILGKPSNFIYDIAISSINKLNKSKTLAIGDSLSHDILGANKFGIKSVLITSGVHRNFFLANNLKWNNNLNSHFNLYVMPEYICNKLIY